MIKLKLNTIAVELHDTLQTLPAVAESFLHYYLTSQSGTGATVEDVRRHYSGAMMRLQANDVDGALIELENADYTLQNMQMNFNPEHCAWACLIASVDGEPLTNYENDYLAGIVERLSLDGLTVGKLQETLEEVKKKWMSKSNTTSPNRERSWIDNPQPDWIEGVSF